MLKISQPTTQKQRCRLNNADPGSKSRDLLMFISSLRERERERGALWALHFEKFLLFVARMTGSSRMLLTEGALPVAGSSDRIQPEPTVTHPTNDPYTLGYRFNISMAIVVVIIVAAFLFLGFVVFYLRNRWSLERRVFSLQQQGQPEPRGFASCQGLDRGMVEKFPLVRCGSAKAANAGRASMDCSVCLAEIEDDEKLRILPKCGHGFHPDCIDLWLLSHSTCPICRISLAPSACGHIARVTPSLQALDATLPEAQDAGPGLGSGAGADSGLDSGSGSGSGSGAGADAGADAGSGLCTNLIEGADSGSGSSAGAGECGNDSASLSETRKDIILVERSAPSTCGHIARATPSLQALDATLPEAQDAGPGSGSCAGAHSGLDSGSGSGAGAGSGSGSGSGACGNDSASLSETRKDIILAERSAMVAFSPNSESLQKAAQDAELLRADERDGSNPSRRWKITRASLREPRQQICNRTATPEEIMETESAFDDQSESYHAHALDTAIKGGSSTPETDQERFSESSRA